MKKIVTLLFALATVIIPMLGQDMPTPSLDDSPVYTGSSRNPNVYFSLTYDKSTHTQMDEDGDYDIYYKVYEDKDGIKYLGANVIYTDDNNISIRIPEIVTISGYFVGTNKNVPNEYVNQTFYVCRICITNITNLELYLKNFQLDLSNNSSIKIIDDNAFYNCNFLTSIQLPQSLTTIGKSAFEGCTNLTEVKLPQSLTTLGIYAFSNTRLSGTLTIPESIKNIPNAAFSYCSSLSDIIIEEGVTSIGAHTFANCGHINSLTLPSTLKTIGAEQVFVPKDTTSNENHGAFAYTDIKNIYIEAANPPLMILATEKTNQQFNNETLENGNFYIPCGLDVKQAYCNADGWKEIPKDHYFSKEQNIINLYVQPDENLATTDFFAVCENTTGQFTYTIEVELTDEYKNSGYKFLGWFTSAEAATPIYEDMRTEVNPETDGRVFYARFAEPAKEIYAWRWDANKVYLLFEGASKSSLSSSFGDNIYEYTYNPNNNVVAGQSIIINNTPIGEVSLIVPMIVTGTQSLSGIINKMNGANNIVVCDGATLTIDQSLPATTKNITVNEGAKLNITTSVSLDTLVLWANPYTNNAAQVVGYSKIDAPNIYFDCLLKYEYASVSFPTIVPFRNITYYDRGEEVSLGAFFYNEHLVGEENAWDDALTNTNSFDAGKGYLMWSGEPKNGKYERIRFQLQESGETRNYPPNLDNTKEAEYRNWTFTGSLATSTLSSGQGSNIIDYHGIQGGISGYRYDGDKAIALADINELLPYKGYLIQMPDDLTEIKYSESLTPFQIRRVQETTSYKTGIILTQESSTDRIIFRVGEQYTPAYDLGADLTKMFTGREHLTTYTLLNSTPLAINATTPELAQLSMPLGFRTVNTDSPLTFSLDSRYNTDNISALYLHDNITDTTVDLLAQDYTFTTDLTQDDSRFTLALITEADEQVGTALQHNTDNPLYAYAANGTLLVAGFTQAAEVSVFDISGRLITNANGCTTTARFSLPAGHYIVNVKQGAQHTILRAIVH